MGWPHWNTLPKPPGHLPAALAPPPQPEFQVLPEPISAFSTFPGRLANCAQYGNTGQRYPPGLAKVLRCGEQNQGTPVVMATRNSGHTGLSLDICELTSLSSRQPSEAGTIISFL